MIAIVCCSCSHRFQRTASQVLSNGICPRCSSQDIDLDVDSYISATAKGTIRIDWRGGVKSYWIENSDGEGSYVDEATARRYMNSDFYGDYRVIDLTKSAELGEPERGLCPRCNTANLSAATGRCSQCGYEVMNEHEVKAVDWLFELRRLQSEEGLSFDDALARVNAMPEHRASRVAVRVRVTENCQGLDSEALFWKGEEFEAMSGPRPNGDWGDVEVKTRGEYEVIPAGKFEVIGSLQQPTDSGVPGSGSCPGCGQGQYDGSSCSNCGYTPDDGVYASKVTEITNAVLASNPGMRRNAALSIAQETIRRYPKVMG